MNSREILNEIATKRRQTFIIRFDKSGNNHKQLEIDKEVWNITVTNNPNEHFASINPIGKQSINSSFPVSSIEEGENICKEIMLEMSGDTDLIQMDEKLESSKQVFIAVHINYITN